MARVGPADLSKPVTGLYKDLQLGSGEIRLLSLKPNAEEDSVIKCTLHRCTLHRLRRENGSAGYVALSYVWGDPSLNEAVTVNGLVVPITKNLASALRAIRKILDAPCPLWVDSICIDQSNVPERNQQVQMMRSIYESAGYAIAYLGPEADDSSYCIQIFARIALATSKLPPKVPLTTEWLKEFPELCRPDKADNVTGNRAWNAIRKFFARPYWERMWIFQEAVVAREVVILCGDERMCIDNIVLVSSLFDNIILQEPPPYFSIGLWLGVRAISWQQVNRVALERIAWQQGKRSSLYDLVRVTLFKRATDPRDALYALVGLANTSFPINYSRNVDEIYCDFTMRFAATEGFFTKLVRMGGIGMMIERAQRLSSLPSWVPDWSILWARRDMDCLSLEEYETCPSFCVGRPNPRFSPNGRHLYVKGTLVDEVSRIRPVVNENNEVLWKTAEMVFFCTTDATGNALTGYPAPMPRLQAVFRLLQGDIEYSTESRLDSTSEVFAERAAAFLMRLKYALTHVPLDWPSETSLNREHVEAFCALILPALQSGLEESGEHLKELILGNPATQNKTQWPPLPKLIEKADEMQLELGLHSYTRYVRIFHTVKGYLGAGPPGILDGDCICVLAGCRIPVVLRRVDTHYCLVGPCLVIGLMDGEAHEAAKRGDPTWEEFEIH
jgi:hypothetical protein